MQQFSIPKLTLDHRGRYYVSFLLNGKRHRFANGRALDIALDPNRLDPSIRQEAAEELCYLIHGKLLEGWGAEVNKDEIRALDAVRSFTVDPAFTTMYTKALQLTQRRFIDFLQRRGLQTLKLSDVKDSHIRSFLVALDLSVSSYNHELKHIASILSKLLAPRIVQPCIPHREEEEHQRFTSLSTMSKQSLQRYASSTRIYGCVACSPTVACFVHTKIRQLTWGFLR